MLYALAQTRPRQAIPELETLLHTYPHVPNIYNYLSVAYSAAGEKEKAEHLVAENYRRHPDYLFARILSKTTGSSRGACRSTGSLLDMIRE